MNDIVERLRSPEVFFTTGQMHSPVAHAAADEIVDLRRKLARPRCEALEEAARWHDEQEKLLQEKAREVSEFSLSIGLDLLVKAGDHRRCAAAIRALKDETNV